MNFGEEDRDQYCDKEEQEEEDEEVMTSKLPFSSPNSSSSSSSKYKNLLSPHNQNLWLGSFESHQDNKTQELPPPNLDNKRLDLMDFSLATNNQPDTSGGGAGGSSDSLEREHMFDKVVTPSDVGKLNRLVIPKQHAEKYFPLDSSSTEKGLLLNFEDRNGKSWRFRYSYWNSSQSYVMTKGWSRFVKEKKLDAGDIVSFQRGVGDAGKHRLYIDWRRRPNAPDPASFTHLEQQNQLHFSHPVRWGRLYSLPQSLSSQLQLQHMNYMQQPYHQHHNHQYHHRHHHQVTGYGNAASHHQYPIRPPGSHPHQIGGGGGGGDYPYHQHQIYNQNQYHQHQYQQQQHHAPMVIDSVPVVHGKTVGKRLRLFGVNMECPTTQDETSSSSLPMLPHHLPPSHPLPPLQLRMPNAASSMPAAAMRAELSKKGKSSLSFDLDL